MEHEEAGCQAPPEGPILCVNNCGFFGSSSNMNMCSKCYKDLMLKQEQAQIAASSIENIVNGSSSGTEKEEELPLVQTDSVQLKPVSAPSLNTSSSSTATSAEAAAPEPKPNAGPSRCSTCKKRVGLMGFKCRCGDLFCGSHRYSDKHDCPFDYRSTGRDAIAKANPVVKAEKLEKI